MSSSSPSLPPSNVKGGALSDVNCTGLRCITVGTYNGGFPLILRSGNGGSTWDYFFIKTPFFHPRMLKGVTYLQQVVGVLIVLQWGITLQMPIKIMAMASP